MEILIYIAIFLYSMVMGISCTLLSMRHEELMGEHPTIPKYFLYSVLSLFWPILYIGVIIADYTQTVKKKR